MVLDNQEYIDNLGLACPNCYRTEEVESNRVEADADLASKVHTHHSYSLPSVTVISDSQVDMLFFLLR